MAVLKKCLGVDLGTNTIKVVELSWDKNGVKAGKAGSVEIGLELNATPEERRTAILKSLKEALKKIKSSTKNAVFSLPGQKVFIRRFRLPQTSPERLERVINYEARQQIPFDITKTDFQYQIYEIPEDREVEILLAAVRHDEIRSFMGLIGKTGLSPVAVAVSSFAVFNAQSFFDSPAETILQKLAGPKGKKAGGGKSSDGDFSQDDAATEGKAKKGGFNLGSLFGKKGKAEEKPDEEVADDEFGGDDGEMVFDDVKGFLNIGAGATDLAIATQNPKQAFMKFARSVPNAGNDMTKSIMSACNVSSFLDAERIKKHQSHLLTATFEEGADPNLNPEACSAATQSIDRVLGEVRKTLDFFISQADGMAVDALVISGGQVNLPGMKDYIEEKLTVPVEIRDTPPENIPFQWPEDTSLTDYVVATGLALQGIGIGGISVDFLPADKKISRDFPWKMVAILGALFIGSMYFMSQSGQKYARDYTATANNAQGLMDRNRPLATMFQKAQQRRDEIAEKYNKFAETVPQREYALDFLMGISNAKPSNVVLSTIDLDHDGTVEIIGVSEFQAAAANFNNGLKEAFPDTDAEPTVNASGAQPGDRYGFVDIPTVYAFQITFKLGDKYNRMEITPTPDPNLQNQNQGPGGNRPNAGGGINRQQNTGANRPAGGGGVNRAF